MSRVKEAEFGINLLKSIMSYEDKHGVSIINRTKGIELINILSEEAGIVLINKDTLNVLNKFENLSLDTQEARKFKEKLFNQLAQWFNVYKYSLNSHFVNLIYILTKVLINNTKDLSKKNNLLLNVCVLYNFTDLLPKLTQNKKVMSKLKNNNKRLKNLVSYFE